ncbi:transglycosylase SLT domain-containing protein [Psychromonas sp.]|uniref:transglycosylase SLT domain-containing protein n=1 Tax=Psychromonas sp. TaxID=1884585 RepID=UPI0035695B6D
MNKLLLLCCAFLPLTTAVFASTLERQRELYSQASVLQAQGKWQEAKQRTALMTDYPLTYLLEYQALKANFATTKAAEVQTFINNNPARSVSLDLQRDYLRYLAKNNAWQEFLEFYPQQPNSGDLKCYYFQAKVSQNKTEAVWPEFKKTWLTGLSLANACDDVIAVYREKNKFSQELIWQRFRLAFEKNSSSLMRYLITWMEGENKALATQLYALHKKPAALSNSELFERRKQLSFPFLLTSIKRLARTDLDSAISVLNSYQDKIPLNKSEVLQLKKYVALRILLENEVTLLPWLDQHLISLKDSDLIELRIRYAIKSDNWQDIEYWLKVLPAQLQKSTKWVYWQARVLENKLQQKQADKLYRKIANERSYYSFLAVQKLGLDYQLNAKPVSDNTGSLKGMEGELAHIEELVFQKGNILLKREWQSLLNNNDKDTQLQLGLYAYQKGWAHLSVLASINTKSWDALNIRFPEVQPSLFSDTATQYQIEPTYIYAIARQESAFDEAARSHAGARGYMQLMPGTAKDTAQMIGLKEYKDQAQLKEGGINVALGTAYFDMLLKRYNGNRILATAAYNAGPSRVDRWRGSQEGRAAQGLKMDSWVETIPYKETRNYVQNVLAYNVIYQHILDKPREFFNKEELNARY